MLPLGWEDFADVHLVVVHMPVLVSHPPRSIVFELVIQFIFQSFMIIPSFIFICKFSTPFSMSPRVSNSYQLQSIHISHIKHSISMIEQYTCIPHSFNLLLVFIFLRISTSNQISQLVVFLYVFPELPCLNQVLRFSHL